MAQGRRVKTRSQSASQELSQVIDQGQQHSKAKAEAVISISSSSSSLSSSSSTTSRVGTPEADRVITSPGLLNWVRNALSLGSTRTSSQLLDSTSYTDHALDRSERRDSNVSSTTTMMDDNSISNSSSDEDVYCPFTYKSRGSGAAAENIHEKGRPIALASAAQKASLPVENIGNSFSSHLSIYQAKDLEQFVQDTTTAIRTMPDLILTPPIERNKTPTPANLLGNFQVKGDVSVDSSSSFLSTESADRQDPSTPEGDGEDLEDMMGRPRSPEELARIRPSRETIVLGSRGAGSRALLRGQQLTVSTGGLDMPEVDQDYWSAVLPKTPSTDTSAMSPAFATLGVERRTASEVLEGDRSIMQTASPQPRRAMNFFNRKRDGSNGGVGAKGGIQKESSDANRTEASKRETASANSAFWKLNKRQTSNQGSTEDGSKDVKVSKNQLDVLVELPQSDSVGADSKSNIPLEPDTPLKLHSQAVTSETVVKGCNNKKKNDIALLGPLMQPRSVKVRRLKKTTKDRDFARVYLAQELYLGGSISTEDDCTPELDTKPALSHLESSNSVASSLASSSTACSKGSGSNTVSTKKKATWAMKFSLDGKYLAIAGQDAIIRVYATLDTEAAREKVESDAAKAADFAALSGYNRHGSTCSVNSLGKNSIGRKSFSSRDGQDRYSSLPNLAVFNPIPVREFKGHTSDILDLNWSKGGFLLSAGMDKTARVWNLAHPNSLISFVHGDFVTSAVFHPKDDRFFLSGCLDGKLRLWNISAKRVQSSVEVPGLITACSFTESGSTACVGTFAGHALFYQTEGLVYSSSIAVRSPSGKHAKGGRKITSISPLLSLPASVSSTTTTKRQGERILITSNDSRIRAYDLKNKAMIARFKAKSYSNRTSQIRANVSDDNIFVVAGSEATYGEGGQIHIWNASSHLLDTTRKTSTKSIPSSLSTDFNVEYFSAHSATVTCAIMAPQAINCVLIKSNDYLLQESQRRLGYSAKTSSSSSPNMLSPSASLTNVLSNAVQYPMKLAVGNNEVDVRRLNRIIVSVDENAVVRIFRSDSLHTVEG